ncbi:hypothetical protein ACLM5H_06125 [Fredinandcohnia humi]
MVKGTSTPSFSKVDFEKEKEYVRSEIARLAANAARIEEQKILSKNKIFD